MFQKKVFKIVFTALRGHRFSQFCYESSFVLLSVFIYNCVR